MNQLPTIRISRRITCQAMPVLIAAVIAPLRLAADEVDYVRDIRPILAANCFACHGSDESHREAGLRLDTFDGATTVTGGRSAIVPGHPESGELLRRVMSSDADQKMPPAETGKTLTTEQVSLLRQWISDGAVYKQHWAFVPPVRPVVPDVSSDQVRNPIDAFILQRLRKEELSPSAPADARTLLRRASLDLTGLPPTTEEIAEFDRGIGASGLTDDAWTAVVERLLASPHFGEKWARHWLDAARYADSDGFEKDKPRFVWFYRDWVVQALNDDLPYDRFLVEQLAGDLLPNPTQSQRVATGFLRNSMINEEGGVDPEQFRMEAMFDRMDAVGKAMVGLTIQCTQCHNHKYDPLAQTDYYRLFAILNNSDEAQATVYTPVEQQQRERIRTEVAAIETAIRNQTPDWPQRLLDWKDSLAPASEEWIVMRPELDASGGQKHFLLEDGSILAQGYAPTKHTTEFTADTTATSLTGFRLELLCDPNLPHGGPGRSIDGLCAVSEFKVIVEPLDTPGQRQTVTLKGVTADVNPPERELAAIYSDKSKDRRVTGPATYAIDGNNLTAWGIDIGGGRSNVPRQAVFVPEQPLTSASGFRVTFQLVQMHGGWNSDDKQNNNPGRFRFSVTSTPDPKADPVPATIRTLAGRPADTLTAADRDQLFSWWRTTVPEFATLNDQIENVWKQHPQGTTQLVLQERTQRRRTYLLTRGDFLKPTEEMQPGVPGILSDGSEQPQNRLEFARWLTRRSAPTTARAIVNRIWQEYFGIGLVRTAEDLGTQGEYPSHPELLDWLAVELMDHGWSLKHIHRLILTSATWRQDSRVTPELLAKDPENRLLARGPRFRVPGETVRDIFLTASGLLNPEIGGPGVYPPAPEFLFQPPASYGPKTWALDTDSERYRRALYTFRFRSVPYPVLQNFDTPRGDIACVRRSRSNTPLQALTTLNEELFMDCCRGLALHVLQQTGLDREDRLRLMMRRCLTREATTAELARLSEFHDRQLAKFSGDPAAAWELAALDPKSPPELPAGAAAADLAALTATARVILNLDETITKE